MSAEYDAEFWFDAAGYMALDWKANFTSEAEARKAFDAWLNHVRAEAWHEGYQQGYCVEPRPDWANALDVNPYKEAD